MTAHSKTIPATLIPGDGIGPEIVESVIEILDAVDAPFVWDRQLAGMAGVDAVNDPLPKQTIESIRRTGLALKGPLTTPVGGGFKSINVTLRQEFGLFANLRPTKTIVPGGRFEDIDLVLFRENLEAIMPPWSTTFPWVKTPRYCSELRLYLPRGMPPDCQIRL